MEEKLNENFDFSGQNYKKVMSQDAEKLIQFIMILSYDVAWVLF